MSFVKVNLVLKTDRQTNRPKYRSDLPSLKNCCNYWYLAQCKSISSALSLALLSLSLFGDFVVGETFATCFHS